MSSTSMTPIKVRGKKQAKFKCPVDALLNPYSKGKRPLSPASAIPIPAKRSCQAAGHLNSKAETVKHAPSLESLPTELLEKVFFFCLNVSLPQASLVIGHKLASHHVKSQLTLRVLSSPSSTDYPCDLAAVFPTLREQAEAQSAILRLKWMTLPFLRGLIPEYIVKTLARELGAQKLRWMGNGPLVSATSEPWIRQYLNDNAYRLDEIPMQGLPAFWEINWAIPHHDSPADTASGRLSIDGDSRAINVGIGLRDGLVALGVLRAEALQYNDLEEGLVSVNRWRILCGVEGCRIPEKLLHGPWTEEKCEFLEIAIRGNCSVDWVGTLSGEIAKEGLLQALEEQNARAVQALVARKSPIDSCKTCYYPDKESRALNRHQLSTYQDVPVRRGVGIIPTTEHIRKALTAKDYNRDIVDLLLQAAEFGNESFDTEIFRWVQ